VIMVKYVELRKGTCKITVPAESAEKWKSKGFKAAEPLKKAK